MQVQNNLIRCIAGATGIALTAAVLLFAAPMAHGQSQGRALTSAEQYPYGEAQFTHFVRDSYQWSVGSGDGYAEFYKSFDASARQAAAESHANGLSTQGIDGYLKSEAKRIARIASPSDRAAAQTELATTVFRIVKKAMPRFSLDRGFEFPATVRVGERQCLLQSVVAAGLLQKAGVPAGIAMVWKSERGGVSNLGHCIAIVRLADGADRTLDLSSDAKTKFVPDLPHQGLFLADASGYRFVEPQYDSTRRIQSYLLTGTGKTVKPSEMRLLDTAFVRSQFYYYRGERAPGHLIWNPLVPESLPRAVQALNRSIQECPQNPLSMYMLGKALAWQGKKDEATAKFVEAHRLYRSQGRVPDSAEEVYSLERVAQANGKGKQ